MDDTATNQVVPPPLPRRATIGDTSCSSHAAAKQRRKNSIVACDRCRRRKIRCDGSQPCATCARFGVRCNKTEERRDRASLEADRAALEDRVRLLEARFASATTASLPLPDVSERPSQYGSRPAPPSLRLQTEFDDQSAQRSYSFDGSNNPQNDWLSPDVPMIQITSPVDGSPTSSVMFSPSPSLASYTTRASTPDTMFAHSSVFKPDLGCMLSPGSVSHARTPPLSPFFRADEAHNWAPDVESLSPRQGWLSRRSSVSSFGGLDQDLSSIALEPQETAQYDWISMPASNDSFTPQQQIPSRADAERMANLAFESLDLPLDRTTYQTCLEVVYSLSDPQSENLSSSHSVLLSMTPFSLRMAKCQTLLVLAMALKTANAFGDFGDQLNLCYKLAADQMKRADFWDEAGATEVATLLTTLGKINVQ